MEPFFTCREDGPVTIVCFLVESLMNAQELERIGQNLDGLIQNEQCKHLVLDMAKVQYLSSQALGIILSLDQKLRKSKRKLELHGVRPQLMELLKITRLDRRLAVVAAPAG